MSKTEWKEYTLDEVCSRLSSGKNIPASEVFEKGLYPVYGGNGLRGYADKSNFEGDCAIIGRQGAFCGNVRFFSGKGYMTEHAVVVCGNEKSDIRYLSYLLSTMQLGRLSGQSAQPGLAVGTLAKQKILLPPLAEQQRIAKILSSLDDKIELNNAINRNLEEQAQAIFKSWFVDFEPFGGEMPEDWSIGNLFDIAGYEKEKISLSELTEETYYSTENMLSNKAGVTSATNLPTIEQTTRCFPGETIISNIRPYFKKIFYCTEDIAGCSTDVLCFKPKKESFSIYNYDLLYSDNFFDYMVKGSKGTKMPRGDKSQIMNYDVVIPAESVISDFNNVVSNILQQISNNKKENECLAKLRDTLLPDLMSGELCLNT